MKKFLFIFLFFCLAGGTVFFFGWAQLKVPPGEFGVIRSKTFGPDPRPVREGEFRWLWYKLIPGNVRIDVFRLDRISRAVSLAGTLPSGAAYAELAGLTIDFSYEARGSLAFSLRPDSLVSFVSANAVSAQRDLDTALQALAESVEALILRRVREESRYIEELAAGSSPGLEAEIQGQFPMITGLSLGFTSVKFPDLALYAQAKELYAQFILGRRDSVSEALGRRAEAIADTRIRFEELEKYGELLSKYPILLEYLAIERGIWREQPAARTE